MKWITYISLFLVCTVSAQKFHTNRPEIIYPAMEKFIAENYSYKTEILHKLQKLDSIIIQDVNDYKPNKNGTIHLVFAYSHISENMAWIEIDPFVLNYPQVFETIFIHELGHVLGLEHINVKELPETDPVRSEIMAHPRKGVMTTEEFYRVKENYYTDLHKLLMTKIQDDP